MYDDPVRQEAACKSVPVDELEEKALVSLAKEGKFKPSKGEKDHAFLLQLLFWFKQSFRWVNSPPCENCGSGTSNIGMGAPLPSEIDYGGSRVELYSFWKRGEGVVESGPIASCSTAELLVMNLIWWMHLDPCQGVFDNSLLYEKGWNKKLNYVIAIAKDGVYDVTKRYTRKWHEVLSRCDITTETVASAALSSITKERRARYSSSVLPMLEHRDQKEIQELEGEVHRDVDDSLSLPGRQSGAIEWRIARSEVGSNGNNSLSYSSCPWELEYGGNTCLCLAGDPILTSLALPVALDAVDEITNSLNSDDHFGKDDMEFPKLNRLSFGFVLASGEELPVGIATSAFDGIRSSKWEEPNGAKGCWLLYKVLDDQMHELETYHVMSANNAPERDPVDWAVEGSDDGGINWYVLDKQNSQLFERRFQHKIFEVDTRRKSNAFRLRFLSQ